MRFSVNGCRFHFFLNFSSIYNAMGNTNIRSSSAYHSGIGRKIYSNTRKTARIKRINAKIYSPHPFLIENQYILAKENVFSNIVDMKPANLPI
jgi:hypothetical protein